VNPDLIFTVGASAVFLGLAGLGATRSSRSTLAAPTALLCVDLFAYNTLELLGNLTAAPYWQWLESAAAAMAAPLLFHLALTFLGARRQQRVGLRLTYGYFGAIAASCAAPFVQPDWASYPGGDSWALAMLAGVLVSFGYASALLVRHYRATGSAEERARTQLFILTVVVGVGGPATDLAAIAGAAAVPRLAAARMLTSALLLTGLALRSRVLRGTIPVLVVNAALIGVVGVIAQLQVFRAFGGETTLFVIGTISVTLLLLMAARAVWSALTEHRTRTVHLATLGRLSAQMAHDIRNPLAAIHGAAQYLDEERKRGGTLEEHREFLEIILEQTARLERVVQDYRRLGRAEPELAEVDVEALLAALVEGANMATDAKDRVEVRAELDAAGIHHLDAELLRTAVENLVRNAVEGIEEKGTVIVRASVTEARGRRWLVLEVIDDGPGMDARTRERAEQDFFTTKAQGSGLGLAFARRVAEAHGGEMMIESNLGRGTRVRLTLPVDARVSVA
jgi:signal transduction histidine kinase